MAQTVIITAFVEGRVLMSKQHRRTALVLFSYDAMKNSHDYDDAITRNLKGGKSGEALFFELAIEDLKQAADLLYSRLKSCI